MKRKSRFPKWENRKWREWPKGVAIEAAGIQPGPRNAAQVIAAPPSPDPLTRCESYFHASIRVKTSQICVQGKLRMWGSLREGFGRKKMRNLRVSAAAPM